MLFAVLGLVFLKTQVYTTFEHYEPTISLNEVIGLSNTEIVEKLFIRYLEHYKDKPIFDDQRIKEYKFVGSSEKFAAEEGTVFFLTYSFKQHFWNDSPGVPGHRTSDGMLTTSRYVSLIKEKDQFRLKIMGLEPPEKKK
jgi:hypothetical protein